MHEIERYRGCLLGLAVGDAVGTTLEFNAPGTFRPIDDMVGGGPFRLKPGQWTDDTSMALCLAESLIEQQGFDAADQMAQYVRWYRDGHQVPIHCPTRLETLRTRNYLAGHFGFRPSERPSAGSWHLAERTTAPDRVLAGSTLLPRGRSSGRI